MIEVTHLHKRFGPVVAVDDLSFTARDGAITGLLGPNGAGKTTTLRMLYTLLHPDAGSIRIDGVDPASEPLLVKRQLGVVPDSRGLYERLTARENIGYFAALHGLSRDVTRTRTASLARTLGMESFLDRRTQGFSQGQRVKIAIARALVHEPRTVLLDEPSNGLDVMTTRALREFLQSLRDAGHCIILSTHIMQEVAALCDHIVIVDKGRVAAAGSPAELLSQAGTTSLEDAFVRLIGSGEGLMA